MNNPAHSLRLIQTAPAAMRNQNPMVHKPFPCWVVETVCSGQYEARSSACSDWIRLGEGEGVLYRPGVRFEERVPTGLCRSVFAIFEFDDTVLSEPLAKGQAMTRLMDPFALVRSALEGLQQFTTSPEDQIGKQGLLCSLIYHLAKAQLKDERLILLEKDDHNSRFSDRVDKFMHKNLHAPLSIADIAAHMKMSASGLQHAYQRETGHSPMQSRRIMRLERVKALLLKDGMGLDAIAEETGFCDAFHLSRSFKAHEGMPPKAYRQIRWKT
jgi:AraC-like DNA-binding protein